MKTHKLEVSMKGMRLDENGKLDDAGREKLKTALLEKLGLILPPEDVGDAAQKLIELIDANADKPMLEQSLEGMQRLLREASEMLESVPEGVRSIARLIDGKTEGLSGPHVFSLGSIAGELTVARAIIASAVDNLTKFFECDCPLCQASRNAPKAEAQA